MEPFYQFFIEQAIFINFSINGLNEVIWSDILEIWSLQVQPLATYDSSLASDLKVDISW